MIKKPYKFLEYYSEKDVEIFFGREKEIEILLADVIVARLVVLFAKTGSGKTSLINAGVRPRLEELDYATFFIRTGSDPTASAVAQLSDHPQIEDLEGKTLADKLECAKQQLNQPIVLFFDQFEEFFIYTFKEERAKAGQFISDVARMYENKDSGVHIVFSLREDWFVELDHFRDQIPSIFHNESSLRLRWFDKNQAQNAIELPAKQFKVKFEKKLVEKLIADLSQEREIEPAQLQIVCDTLWRQKSGNLIRLEDYLALGRKDDKAKIAHQILIRRLEEEFQKIEIEEQLDLLEKILPELRTERGTKYVRYIDELVKTLAIEESTLNGLIEVLERARIIKRSRRDDSEVIELTHDYLVERLEDIRASVRTIWPRRILSACMQSNKSMTPDDLEKILDKVTDLRVDKKEAEFLFRSALASRFRMDDWFKIASNAGTPVWKIIKQQITGKDIIEAFYVLELLTELALQLGNDHQKDSNNAFKLLEDALQRDEIAWEAQNAFVRLTKSKRDDTVSRARSVLVAFLRKVIEQDNVALQSIEALGWIETWTSVDLLEKALGQIRLRVVAQEALRRLSESLNSKIESKARAVLSRKARAVQSRFQEKKEGPPARSNTPSVSKRPRLDRASIGTATLATMVRAIKQSEIVLFLGAGVHASPSKESKYKYPPDWKPLLGRQLVEIMATECDFQKNFPDESVLDLQRVSLYYELSKGLGRSRMVDFLSKHVQEGKKPSPALQMLAALPFKIVITTNYDHLFEKALVKVDKDPHVFVYDPSPAADERTPDLTTEPTIERPLLYKMHGDLDKRDSIVITDEDYINFVQRMSEKDSVHPLPPTIRFRMTRWPILFVGYSLRDYNLRLLFRTLRWKVEAANFPKAYFVDKSPDPLILQVWQNERGFANFLMEDMWTFIPALYEAVRAEKYPA